MRGKRAKQLKKLAYELEQKKLENTIADMGLQMLNLTEAQKHALTVEFAKGFTARYKLLKKRYKELRRKGRHYPQLYKKKEAA